MNRTQPGGTLTFAHTVYGNDLINKTNSKGQKCGLWEYCYLDGMLGFKENFKKGELVGEVIHFIYE